MGFETLKQFNSIAKQYDFDTLQELFISRGQPVDDVFPRLPCNHLSNTQILARYFRVSEHNKRGTYTSGVNFGYFTVIHGMVVLVDKKAEELKWILS